MEVNVGVGSVAVLVWVLVIVGADVGELAGSTGLGADGKFDTAQAVNNSINAEGMPRFLIRSFIKSNHTTISRIISFPFYDSIRGKRNRAAIKARFFWYNPNP